MASLSAAKRELRFDGRVCIVTGAGGGLGRAYALLLASRGAKVCVNDVGGSVTGAGADSRAADKVVNEIRAAGGFAVADYNSVEAGDKIVATAMSAFGRVDALVCNAGILRDASFIKLSDDAWDAVLRVHLKGSFACARAAWPIMREQGYGRVVFVTSSSGLYGNFGQANYAAAKMGILGLASTLAREGAKRGVIVNTVAPIAASRMTESVMPPDLLEALKPEAVAPVVAFLCHESCTTNGMLYEVGGGWLARLRWQRSQGAFLPANDAASLLPESVRDVWERVGDFSTGASFPDSTQSAFEPIMENLRRASGGGDDSAGGDGASTASGAATSTDDAAALAAGRALADTTTDAAADIDASIVARYMEPMAGGNKGSSAAVNVAGALSHRFKPIVHGYNERDMALYALSVGASADASNAEDLRFTYELHSAGMRALPGFAVLFPHAGMADLTSLPALQFNPMMLLHGEHELVCVRPLPVRANVTTQGRVTNIYDKGSGAVVIYTSVSTDNDTGEVYAINRASIFIRGIGGFGGDRGASAPSWEQPSRAPAVSEDVRTPSNAALLYRLNGDTNPLHADPDMAAMGGFPRPILHGLYTFGVAARVILKAFGDNDPARFRAIRARFVKHVFPGETVRVAAWRDDAGSRPGITRILFTCSVVERGELVLTSGVAEVATAAGSAVPRL